MKNYTRLGLLLSLLALGGCTAIAVTGAVVGTVATVASVAVEVVEVPFEVAGAAIDLASDDEEKAEEEAD